MNKESETVEFKKSLTQLKKGIVHVPKNVPEKPLEKIMELKNIGLIKIEEFYKQM